MNDPISRYEFFQQCLLAAEQAGCADDPDIQEALVWSLSPLCNGAISEEAMRKVEAQLAPRLLAARLQGAPPPVIPDHDPRTSIAIGQVVRMNKEFRLQTKAIPGHIVVAGATGSGKTTAEAAIIDGLVEKRIHVDIFARKEAGRFLRRYPKAVLLRPDQLPVNFLDPIGDPRLYFAELAPILARGVGLRSDYVPDLLDVLIRVHASQPED